VRKPKKKEKPVERINAVTYLRVSSEEQVHNLSLATQQQCTIAYCTQHGWPVIKEFRDEGRSAKSIEREAFKAMVRFCTAPANAVGYVVVYNLSRFSRDANDQLNVRTQLLRAGVRLRSVCETIDETATGNLTANIIGAVNQFDNEQKADRTKVGMLKAASIGRWPYKAPLGYRNIIGAKEGPNIEPDPETGSLIVKAFELMGTGSHSTADALRRVTQLGLKTAKGKPVTAQTFQKTLVNPLYKGVIRLPEWDFTGPGNFTPLVSAELFDRVQDILSGRRPNLTEYQRNHPDFPLRVFVRCAHCGAGITGSYSTGRDKTKHYPYYHCRTKGCRSFTKSPDDVHAAFLDWLTRLAPQPDSIEAIKETIRSVWIQRRGDMDELRASLTQKLSKIEERKKALVDRMVDGVIDRETYKEHYARFRDEAEQTKAEIRSTELEEIDLESVLKFADRIILRPGRLWVESSLEQRQRLQKTLFPNGIEFDGEQFGTDASPLLFRLLGGISEHDSCLASPGGFEPPLPP